ncbi:MAG TPA: hypothetical protein VEP48_01975 [Methylomirabilota bacterium]|nr:hypothetical protein [Methylomirabilota bacterium]
MGSGGQAMAARRRAFAVLWVLASTVPALLGYAAGKSGTWDLTSRNLLVVALALAVLQGLVLEVFFGGSIFGSWLAVTAGFVIAAPYVGFVAWLILAYAAYLPGWLVEALNVDLDLFIELDFSGPLSVIALAMSLVAGGAPAVLAQWVLLRPRVARRWLWTVPVPGLTYGTTFLFARDGWGDAQPIIGNPFMATALALVYAAATALVLVPDLPERRDRAVAGPPRWPLED